jgi:hypothetical protein
MIKKASRANLKLKLGCQGPSGSGKTYSALLLAKGLVGGLEKVCVLDTENGSANLYSQLGDYSVFNFPPPYSPDQYVKAIRLIEKEGFECLIIDSTSHEWEGEGGCLDLQSKLGGRYQDWAKVTPKHRHFIDTILQCNMHVICCMRQKQDYAVENVGGRTKVTKLGTKEVQREGFEYELTVAFNINQEHLATPSKDRTNMFDINTPFLITEDTGKQIRAWNEGTLDKAR